MIYNGLFENITTYMDRDVMEDMHMQHAPCTEAFYLARYIEADPVIIETIESEFGDIDDVIEAVRNMEMLRGTGLTDDEAARTLEMEGAIIYTAADYIEECKKWIEEYDEDDAEHFRCVIADIEAAEKDTHLVYNDGDVVIYDGVKYYVMWVL